MYDPNSRRMVPRAQLEALSRTIYEDDDDPIRERPQSRKQPKQPKVPKQPHLSRAGSHLSRGTVGRTRAPALEFNEEEQLAPTALPEPLASREAEPEADAAPPKPKAKKKKKKKKQTQPLSAADLDIVAAETPRTPAPAVSMAESASVPETHTAPPSAGKQATKSSKNANGATPSPNAKSKVKAVASREPSESPARSARFAVATDQLLVRHEPPPRSLSPRKSALKHASPTRAASPSDDGSETSVVPGSLTPNDDARKKSFRVSWDDRNTVVVTEPTMQHGAEQAASSSPQTKKIWHGIVGKGKKKEPASIETEETMSPRPALPSFGSVREKKPKEQEERPLVRPEHTVQTENATAAGVAPASPFQPNTSKQREPLPTVLQSVEKDEEISSSEDGLMEDTSDEDLDSEVEVSHTTANGKSKLSATSETEIPEISVSHASPRQPQTDTSDQIAPVDVDNESSSDSEELEADDAHAAGLQMDDIKEEEEEGDTYIDAYEEIDEPEGDGFQSLDAVLESPTNSPTVKSFKDKLATEEKESEDVEPANNQSDPPDDWENAKAYWKSLSSEKRRQLEQEAMAEAGEDTPDKAKASKADIRKTTNANAEIVTPKKDRTYQIAPGTIQQPYDTTPESTPTNSGPKANGSSLRKSMRDTQHNETPKSEPKKLGGSMRKTLRAERPVSSGEESRSQHFTEPSASASPSRMKRSLRHNSVDLSSSETRPLLSVSGRPASYHAGTDSPTSMRHAQSLRMNGSASPVPAARGAVMKTSLRRRGSDSSESSFTRARAGSSGGHEFRRSMRGSMRDPPTTSDGIKESNRFSLRPSSPPAMAVRRSSVSSLPPAASFGAGRMRQSLRGEFVGPPTNRRRLPGFGKSGPSKAKKGSRFDDSSDEDEGSMNFFRSRFADSSSEDDGPHTKSNGKSLPKSLRTKSNGRLTSSAVDLPFTQNGRESPSMLDNAVLSPPKRTVGSPLGAAGSGRETMAPLPQTGVNNEAGGGSFRPQHTRRGSFISLLRRKKDPSSKITRELSESAARQDTSLERSPEELEALRNPSLHKRGPSWPLPEPEDISLAPDHSPERPSTAGGAIVSTSSNKSKFARRRSASQGMVAADTADMDDELVTDAVPPKKKKFGTLRKMFRLHD